MLIHKKCYKYLFTLLTADLCKNTTAQRHTMHTVLLNTHVSGTISNASHK